MNRPLPLVRLRNCVLLPRAELEVASRGERPGMGAVEAMDAAGDDGSVVVAYELPVRAGEDPWPSKLHGIGVLARVRRMRAPSPQQIDRWLLRGVSRVSVQDDRIQAGEIPSMVPELFPERAEDGRQPSKEFLDAITELSEEWDAGDHWRSAFQLMVRSPLAQWATSIGTLLPVEAGERFELLDHPERMEKRIREHLDRLIALHSRRRIRQQVVKQAAPRDSRSLPEQILSVPTNVAAWVLFHPDDLGHRGHDGPRWWQGGDAITRELASGNLIGVLTGNDRFAFTLRFTAGGLNSREKRFLARSCEYRLVSRHGRFFVGEPRHLPSSESELFPNVLADSFRWVDVPKGKYRVRVNAIAWREETGAVKPDGQTSENALAAYVLQVEPVESLDAIHAPTQLPSLPASR